MVATAEDRLALVTSHDGTHDADSTQTPSTPATPAVDRLPWVFSVLVQPRSPAIPLQQLALSAAVALASAWLLVQMALLQDAAHVAAVGVYGRGLQVALLVGVALLPGAAAARWAGAGLWRPGRLWVAAALAAAAALMLQAGRRRGALSCNAQDPLLAVVAVFALVAHLLTSPKLHMRPTVAQVVICLGAFVGVSYQACNKYRCHGDDHSGGWRASDSAESAADDGAQQTLWLVTGTAGVALLCGAALLLEHSSHRRQRHHSDHKEHVRSWWESALTVGALAQMALLFTLLFFWTDFIPAFGESASLSETWTSVQQSFVALASHGAYLQNLLFTTAALSVTALLSVRLLEAGRPVFQLASLVCLGVLLSELWWSLFRVDGLGGWVYHPRVTGEAVTAALGIALELGGLAAWWRYESGGRPKTKLAVMEFDMYSAQSRRLTDTVLC